MACRTSGAGFPGDVWSPAGSASQTMKSSPISKFAGKETRGYLRQFKKHLRHTAKHPEDPEAIHDLRVGIRRLTLCFPTCRGLLESRAVKKLQPRLRKVMDPCGAVRNCDVALVL